MITIYAIHAPEAAKLEAVIADMQTMGAPTIEVVDCGDYYQALEGSHRLAAAETLGISPVLIIHEQNEMINIARFDWFDAANWAETEYSAGEVAGELFSPRQSVSYTFA